MYRPLVIVDVETAGVMPAHPTIQLGAVAMESDQEIASFLAYILFDEAAADPEALKMNGYDREVWNEKGEHPLEAGERFCSWIKRFACLPMLSKRTGKTFDVARIAGFNAITFDAPRLDRLCPGFKPFALAPWDIRQQCLWYFETFPEAVPPENSKLETLCDYFGTETRPNHSALQDARAEAELSAIVRRLTRQSREGGIIHAAY